MANKTTQTSASVPLFINSLASQQMRSDSHRLVEIMSEVTGEEAKMWGTSIIGFGTHHYVYESGREGDTIIVGFSPRKQALTLYGIVFYDFGKTMLEQLGKVTTGKGCLYIKKLADIDEVVLRSMIAAAYKSKQV